MQPRYKNASPIFALTYYFICVQSYEKSHTIFYTWSRKWIRYLEAKNISQKNAVTEVRQTKKDGKCWISHTRCSSYVRIFLPVPLKVIGKLDITSASAFERCSKSTAASSLIAYNHPRGSFLTMGNFPIDKTCIMGGSSFQNTLVSVCPLWITNPGKHYFSKTGKCARL